MQQKLAEGKYSFHDSDLHVKAFIGKIKKII